MRQFLSHEHVSSQNHHDDRIISFQSIAANPLKAALASRNRSTSHSRSSSLADRESTSHM